MCTSFSGELCMWCLVSLHVHYFFVKDYYTKDIGM
jgi:hypothetical protein